MLFLRCGARGPKVHKFQWLLAKRGYDPGLINGFFGSKTEQAVLQFQMDQCLTADGIVGPITWRALRGCPQPQPQQDYQMYTIQAGDTFYKLSLKFQVSLESILLANPSVDPQNLQIGQQIRIPIAYQPSVPEPEPTPKPEPEPGVTRIVSGWIPFWSHEQALSSLQEHAQVYGVISPFWYHVSETGEVLDLPNAEDSRILDFARANGISVIPLISNDFNSSIISGVLNDPTLRQMHIQAIADKVTQMDYAGIEINYENLFVADREIFVVFLQELKTVLAGLNKLLVAAVHAKTDPVGDWSGAEAHDYAGISENVDIVRIMGYEYHSQDSPPGPIAPVNWLDAVLAYAVTVIPEAKLELGLPTYGYDWPEGQPAAVLTYAQAVATADAYGAPITTDELLGPHYTYTAEGIPHEVWFIDALLFGSFLDLVNKYDIRGISIWYLGAEDPGIYEVIQAKF